MKKTRITFRGLLSVALLFLTLSVGFPIEGMAQTTLVKSGSITSGTGEARQVIIGPLSSQTIITAQISGSFSATLTPKVSNDGVTYYTPLSALSNVVSGAATATTTSGGFYAIASNGARYLKLEATTYGSGTVSVLLVAGYTANSTSVSGGAGDASASNQIAGNASLDNIDTTTGTINTTAIAIDTNVSTLVTDIANLANTVNMSGTDLSVICTSGCSGGTTDTDDGTVAGGQVTGIQINFPYLWNGSAWIRATGDATNGALVNLGANNDVTVTGTVTANAGTNLNTSTLAVESGGNLAALAAAIASVTAMSGTDLNVICTSGCSGGGGAGDASAANQATQITNQGTMITNQDTQITNQGTEITHLADIVTAAQSVASQIADQATASNQSSQSTKLDTLITDLEALITAFENSAGDAFVRILGSGGETIDPSAIAGIGGLNGTGSAQQFTNCPNTAIYDTNTNGKTQLVALSSSKKVIICGMSLMTSTTSAVTVSLGTGTGTNCGTTYTAITPAWVFNALSSAVMRGFALPNSMIPYYRTAASEELCIQTNAAVSVQLSVTYAQY